MDEVTFHPGCKILVCSGHRDGNVLPIFAKAYAVSDQGLEPLKGEFAGALACFTFTPDRELAAVYFTPERNGPLYGSEVMFWAYSEKAQQVTARQKIRLEKGIKALAVTRDGRWLATGSLDNKVRFWNMTKRPPAVEKTLDVRPGPGTWRSPRTIPTSPSSRTDRKSFSATRPTPKSNANGTSRTRRNSGAGPLTPARSLRTAVTSCTAISMVLP
jgi:WD40 repeat protein